MSGARRLDIIGNPKVRTRLPVPHIQSLQLAPASDAPTLTPQQKKFNARIKQIEQARQKLLDWEASIATFRMAHGEVLRPLQDALLAGQRQRAHALDAALDQRAWSKTDRATLKGLLLEAVGELLETGLDDEPLKALFEKHADVDFEAAQRENVLALKDMAEAMTGMDLGDDDGLDTEEALFERLHQGMNEHAQTQDAARRAKPEKGRKAAAQERREDEDRRATQSVREIYRKLASALHPDRETDPKQRDAKTAMMQRVNQAYEANDLLALLELQLQIEQIDASHIANAGEERLKYYNKVLGEQLDELKAQLQHVEMGFCMEFGFGPGTRLNPGKLGQLVQQTSRAWQSDLAEQRMELLMLDDVAATKRWLKRRRLQWQADDFGFDLY